MKKQNLVYLMCREKVTLFKLRTELNFSPNLGYECPCITTDGSNKQCTYTWTKYKFKNFKMAAQRKENKILVRDVEIPCLTCPTWSHFIQDKLKISIYLALDKCKICIKLKKNLHFTFLLTIMSSHVVLKTVWILISWLF